VKNSVLELGNLIQGFKLCCQTEGKSPLDLDGSNGLMSEPKQERRLEYAGLLREVPCQEGN